MERIGRGRLGFWDMLCFELGVRGRGVIIRFNFIE